MIRTDARGCYRLLVLYALVACFTAMSCGKTEEAPAEPKPVVLVTEDGRWNFPEAFLMGTAIAGFQSEMGCPTMPAEECEDRGSDWYQFITSEETLTSDIAYLAGDPPSAGPGYWELYDEDHARAATELKNNAIRLSIEWSRIFPNATDDAETPEAIAAMADPKAVAHYHAIFDSLKKHGLTPLVTLNHYSLPLWIHNGVACHLDIDNCSPRGWLDRERTVKEIAKYAGYAAREFGAKVDKWVTLNEPFAVALPGYVLPSEDRTNPPAVLTELTHAKTVIMGLIEGHARMYDAIKANDTMDASGDGEASAVGVVYAMVPVVPKNPEEPLDVKAAENVFYLYNMVYLNAVAKGEVDEDLDGTSEVRDDLVGRMDYLGINYYSRLTVEGLDEALLPELSMLTTFNPLTMELWEVYPRGLYEMIQVAHKDLKLPVIVTENGVPNPDDEALARSSLVETLSWLHQAIQEGVDVGGYFYWTLMDNYEWNHGMQMRFGLYEVDINDPNKPRKARPFTSLFTDISGSRSLSPELRAKYPIQVD
jgi:beta-galactosidase